MLVNLGVVDVSDDESVDRVVDPVELGSVDLWVHQETQRREQVEVILADETVGLQ